MGKPQRLSRVFLWTVAGVIVGMVVGTPFAHDAALRDPTPTSYIRPRTGAWGEIMPPVYPDDYGVANAAAHNVMSVAIVVGFFGGLLIGLGRNGFFTTRRIDPDSHDVIRSA